MSKNERQSRDTDSAADRTEKQRRKGLTKEEIHDLELAGGMEGGMKAGSAGGPGSGGDGEKPASKKRPGKPADGNS